MNFTRGGGLLLSLRGSKGRTQGSERPKATKKQAANKTSGDQRKRRHYVARIRNVFSCFSETCLIALPVAALMTPSLQQYPTGNPLPAPGCNTRADFFPRNSTILLRNCTFFTQGSHNETVSLM